MVSSIEGGYPWEAASWLPEGDLPDWLAALRKRHLEAIDEYEKAIAGVVNTQAMIDAGARQWRREVRDAVAAGREPPKREHDPEVAAASVEVATEDANFARRELAEVCISILSELRAHRDEWSDWFYTASPELRYALGRGPDGIDEQERQRRERQINAQAEDAIPNIDDPANEALTQLGDNEASASEVTHAAT